MNNFIEEKARREIFALKPYIPGKPIEEVKRELGIEDVIKMASNENPLGPSPKAVEAIQGMLPMLHFYPDSNCFYLKQRLAAFLKVAENQLLIGNGSDEILRLIAETFLSSGDNVIIAQPTFSEYAFTTTIMGAECQYVPLKEFKHDLNAILAAVSENTKIVYLCNPNNPTGTIVSREEVDEFMARIPQDILVIFDEAYFEYVESPDFVSGLEYVKQGRNVAVLHTFSKIYGLAALRIGYGVSTPQIVAAVERVADPFNVNTLAQVGAQAALDDEKHVRSSQENNSAGKQYIYAELERMGLYYIPTEANFIFLDTGRNCQDVFGKLLQRGVIVRTGDAFGHPDFIRVTIGTPPENQRFIRGLREVLQG